MENKKEKENCLVLIPARGGSKGIPKKNMALLGGKPLIEYTIKAALAARLSGKICLSTDDEVIRNFGLSFSMEAPFLRPSELSQDDSGTIPVIHHALEWYKKNEDFYPSFLVLLQPTSPFRTDRHIREALKVMLKEGADSLISVNQVNEHPCEYIVRKDKGFSFVMEPPEKPGRQNFPEVLSYNGAIHIARVEYFKCTGKLFDNYALLYKMARHDSLDINIPEDLEYANFLLERQISVT